MTSPAPTSGADKLLADEGPAPTVDPTALDPNAPDPAAVTLTPVAPTGEPDPPAGDPDEGAASWVPRKDLPICVGLAAVAAWLGHGLWPHPATRVLGLNPGGQALAEWYLARATRIWAGDFGLVTHLLNVPDGVNLLANASLIGLGAVLAPVTLLLGAPVSFAVAVAANLAATAVGWYLVLRRTLRLRRPAATIGAAFTGFAPGMVAESNAHLHLTAQWLVPAMVWCVLRLAGPVGGGARPRGWRRVAASGALLGGLVAAQYFLGEEVLLLAALTLGLFCVAYAAAAPRRAGRALPPVAGGLAVAAALAALVLARALWVQFAGAQHVPNSPFNPAFFGADLAGFAAISPLSLAGGASGARLSAWPTEYTGFFGVPLLLVVLGAVLWLWRRPAVVAAAAAALALGLLALGPTLVVDGRRTGQPAPFALVADVPLVRDELPARFALALVPLIAIVLATAVDVALRGTGRLRLVVPVAVVAALLPVAPRPLPTAHRPPVPRYFLDGDWRGCAMPGGVLVPVPLPDPANPDGMRWAAAADARFGLPQGWFVGPYAPGGKASLGVYPRPTAQLLARVAASGAVPEITDDDRQAARADVAYWHASCVVLAHPPHEEALGTVLDALFGPGEDVSDVRVWPVG